MNDLSDRYKDDFSDVDAFLSHTHPDNPAWHARTPHDLSDRIIQRAVRMPQKQRGSFGSVLGEFLSFIAVPRPAMAFGVCLMIGLFSGWAASHGVEADDTAYEAAAYDAAQSLNPVVIEEEWL